MGKKREDQENSLKKNFLEKLFIFDNSRFHFNQEILAGISGALIVIFTIISSSKILTNMMGSELSQYFGTFISISIIVSAVLCIIAGFYSKLPIIFSNSLSYTSFISISVLSALGLDWKTAISLIIIESVLFIILCFTPFIKLMLQNLPSYLDYAGPATLGGILIFYSLILGKFISFKGNSELFSLTLSSPESFLFIVSIIILIALYLLKIKGFMIYGIFITILTGMILPKIPGNNAPYIVLISLFVGWILLYAILIDSRKKNALQISLITLILSMIITLIFYKNPESIIAPPSKLFGGTGVFSLPQFKLISDIISKPILSVGYLFKNLKSLAIPIFSLFFTHIITLYAILKSIKLFTLDNYSEKESLVLQKRSTILEGVGGFISGCFGVGHNSFSLGTLSAMTAGGRTGLTSFFAGITFIISLFLIPILSSSIFSYVISPVIFISGLILVIKSINFEDIQKNNIEHYLPILISFIIGALTLNIVQGILSGLLIFVLIKLIEKKYNQITTFTWILLILSLIFSFYRINIPFITIYNF